jgi:[CysO sulfur-carrier protein]-S-L-cysteine hydrolase
MKIARAMVDEIISHAREDLPNECCGLIASRDGEAVKVYRTRNAEASPVRYGLDPLEQYRVMNEIEDADLSLGAIYHSHTRSPAYPSQTDVNLAFYPDALYLIVSLQDADTPDVKAFRIVDGGIEEVELSVAG